MQVNTTLYKQAAKGSIQQWKVFVTGNKITVEFGQVGGKLQTKDTFCKGKNLGRANATTDEEQALAEAKSKWEKQVKKGYVEDSSGERTVLLPMKIESYFKGKMKDKIEFPATSSRKLNGVNGECRIAADGGLRQLSRGGEEYPLPPPDAVKELKQLAQLLNVTSLNYEIYKHGAHLQDIQGAVKAPHHHEKLWKTLKYCVFDLPESTDDWKKRRAKLEAVRLEGYKYVCIIPSREVESHEEIMELHDSYVADGYEGSVVRNYKGLYEYNVRTMDVLKVKYVQSEEFLVEDYFADKNLHPVFWCVSKGGRFKVKPKGTEEQRDAIMANARDWIGKWMTVEFEDYSKDNIPLKPVGIGLREGTVVDGIFTPTE